MQIALSKILQQLFLEVVTVKPDQRSPSKSNAGFTLLEVVFVMVVIGILAAIAAPSWITFTNRQRVNAANDAVLSALQDAQRDAKRTKRSYSVSFGTNNNVPEVAIHFATDTDANKWNWQTLGKDVEVKSGTVLLGTNLTDKNTAGNSISYNSSTAQTISFNEMGMPLDAKLGNKGLIVAVAIPKPGVPTQPLDKTKRCVKVMTLLGAMQTAKEDECEAS